MGMIEKVSDKVGISVAHTEIEVPDRYVFHRSPFTLNLYITSGRKEVRIDSLEIELIWERWMRSGGTESYHSQYLISGGQKEWYESRSLMKMRSIKAFEMNANEKKTMSFTLSTASAEKFAFPDRFHIRIHMDIPRAPDTREEVLIDVLPEKEICAPMIAMLEGLGFRMRHWRTNDDESNHRNQWILDPPEGKYPHLENVRITTPDWKYFAPEVVLEMNMSEDTGEGSGVRETMRSSFPVEIDDLIDPDGSIRVNEISGRIDSLLEEAERDFGKMLRTG